MAAISLARRQRLFRARPQGQTTAEVAARFAAGPAFVRRLLQRHRQTGSLAPESGARGPKPRLAGCEGQIRELLAREPDLHPREIGERLGLAVAAITVW